MSNILKHPLFIAKVKETVAALQANPLCFSVDIGYAIRNLANFASTIAGPAEWRRINGFTFSSNELVVNRDTPQWHMDINWVLDSTQECDPPTDNIAILLPGVHIEPSSRLASPGALKQVIVLDLTRWENVAISVLMCTLFDAFEYRRAPIQDPAMAREKAQALLNYFYPTITLDFLKNAVTLGVLDATTSHFINWFKNHLQIEKTLPMAIPDSLVD